MSVCSDHMRKSWCPGGCEERPMSHCLWKAGRNICEVPSCLLLTTTVYAVSSVKKGLVKIDGLTCAIFVCQLWITHLPAEPFSVDYRLWENMNYICTFHALHFSGLWTLIIMTCQTSNKCRGPQFISQMTRRLWNTFISFQRKITSKEKTASYHFYSTLVTWYSFQLSLLWRTFFLTFTNIFRYPKSLASCEQTYILKISLEYFTPKCRKLCKIKKI